MKVKKKKCKRHEMDIKKKQVNLNGFTQALDWF